MEADILNAYLPSQPDQNKTIAWIFSGFIHVGLACAFLLVWKEATPPMVAPDLLSVEVIMESPSPGGGDGLQQQMQKSQPVPEAMKETIETPIEDVDVLNEKATIFQDVPISPLSDIVLKRKPKPPVQKKQPETPRQAVSKPVLAQALMDIKGHEKAETVNGANQRAGIEKTGFGGTVQSAQYRLGSAGNPKPKYPKIARKRGWQGRVVLSVHVDANGQPVDVQIAQSSGHKILDRAALKTVRKWTFKPARKAGFDIASKLRIPIRFDLMNG
ncbi:TonB family protein [Terasakiella sp.]|uniref:energy transducer TonB n=1 Tax=Terasakiella sp. TaxID=2034861 RepID=UPI003AA85BB6